MKTLNKKILNTKYFLFSAKFKNILTRFSTKESLSILKNKDQTGESDKSYSGTDTKHTYGSDRVLKDQDKKRVTTNVDDSSIHDHGIKSKNVKIDIPDQEQKSCAETKTKTIKEQDVNIERDKKQIEKNEENLRRDTNYKKQTNF